MVNAIMKLNAKYSLIGPLGHEYPVTYAGMKGERHMFLATVPIGMQNRVFEIGLIDFNLIDGLDICPIDSNDVTFRRLSANEYRLNSELEACV
jgi:hypothetical protein